jgi:hypothetical protein
VWQEGSGKFIKISYLTGSQKHNLLASSIGLNQYDTMCPQVTNNNRDDDDDDDDDYDYDNDNDM